MVNKFQRDNVNQTTLPMSNIEEHATALFDTVAKRAAKEASAHGLTPLGIAAVKMFQTDSEWTATELAQLLSTNAPSISRTVNQLVNAGWLRRRRPPDDRRIVFLALTEEGNALVRELHKRAHSYERRITQGISPEELEACLSTIAKVVANNAAWEASESDLNGEIVKTASDIEPPKRE